MRNAKLKFNPFFSKTGTCNTLKPDQRIVYSSSRAQKARFSSYNKPKLCHHVQSSCGLPMNPMENNPDFDLKDGVVRTLTHSGQKHKVDELSH